MAAGRRTELQTSAPVAPRTPPLVDIRVVEYGDGAASAIAGMLLSDAGASVVKVEPPGGTTERRSPAHRVWNRGKQSFVLDPTRTESVTALGDLLRTTDVVIVQQSATWTEEIFRTLAPAAVACSITGFGSKGPLADVSADDASVSTYAGLCADQIGWMPGPSYLAHPLPSTAAALLAVQGIVAALIERARSGVGVVMETSLLAAVFAMSGQVRGDLVPRPRTLSASPRGSAPFYSLFECQDRAWLQLGCLHGGFVQKAIDALGLRQSLQPILDDPRFGDGVTIASEEISRPLLAAMDRTFRDEPRVAWLSQLDGGDVPVAPVLSSKDFLDDPQAKVNGLATVHDEDVGALTEVGPFIRLSRSTHAIGDGAPRLGVHAPAPVERLRDIGTSTTSVPTRLALEGVVVLELSNIIAGPMVGRCLAELGADVIKLESPQGDIFRQQSAPEFLPLNVGKRSICIDLKDPDGNACGRRLAGLADVIVNNMRPGVAERLGLGWDAVRAMNPAAVYCQVTAFGSSGPYALRPGGDPLAGAFTGMQSAQGGAVGKPVYVRGAPIDNVAGMLGAFGILLALSERQRSGVGQRVDTSLLDAGALLNCHAMVSGSFEHPKPSSQYGPHSLERLYEASDGWLYLRVPTQGSWETFCRALGAPHLLSDGRFATPELRRTNDAALADAVGTLLAQLTVDSVRASLHPSGALCMAVHQGTGDLADRQAIANGWVELFAHPTLGDLQMFTGWFGGIRKAQLGPPPLLGQQGAEVLRQHHFTETEIRALTVGGAVPTPAPRLGVM
jgi:crotonobetainyl-CoA:carnitine CoA-transferase CaiB-like acyl-CoA transferase